MQVQNGLAAPAAARVVALVAFATCPARAEPPFSGTIFIDPDIITDADPTAFRGATYVGRDNRPMFDRRTNSFNTVNAYLFASTFADGLSTEFQVNPEFGSEAVAMAQVQAYGPAIGRLPHSERVDVDAVWLQGGDQDWGGGNDSLLIHTGRTSYAQQGIVEETLVHEAAHTSLDAAHANAPGWLAAQQADPEFISTYARDNPTGEDVAESFLPWLAQRYRTDRMTGQLTDTIRQTIPNRLAYFDAQPLIMYPVADHWFLADINGDRQVSVADVGILATNFGQTTAGGRGAGDLNLDGGVTVADVGILATYFGQGAAPVVFSSVDATFAEALAAYPNLAAPPPRTRCLSVRGGTVHPQHPAPAETVADENVSEDSAGPEIRPPARPACDGQPPHRSTSARTR